MLNSRCIRDSTVIFHVLGIASALRIRVLHPYRTYNEAKVPACSGGLMMAAVRQRKPRECQDVTRNSLADGDGQKRANDSRLLRKRQMMDKGEKTSR